MVKYDLTCSNNHNFEGWFRSADEFASQSTEGILLCPFCDCKNVTRLSQPAILAHSFSNKIIEENSQLTKAEKHAIIEQLQEFVDHQLDADTTSSYSNELVFEMTDSHFIELQDEFNEDHPVTEKAPTKKTLQ